MCRTDETKIQRQKTKYKITKTMNVDMCEFVAWQSLKKFDSTFKTFIF